MATNSSGIAIFSAVSLNKTGNGYTLKATESTGAHTVTSSAFNIVAGAAAQLVFTTQPSDVLPGAALNTIAVTEQDAHSNTVISDSTTSVDFTVSACGGTVLGSATMNAGVATLSSAQVFAAPRAGLRVSAHDASLGSSGLSQAFNVGPGDLLFDGSFEACAL